MGRIYTRSDKKTTSDCLAVDIRKLMKLGMRFDQPMARILNWSIRGRHIGSCGLINDDPDLLVLSYTITSPGKPPVSRNQPITIARTPCHYGNTRPWFLCPTEDCGRRVVALYFHSASELYQCRHCCNLTYQCQREDEQDRLFRKRNKYHDKLGHTGTGPLPRIRPRYMHQRTWSRLIYLEAHYTLKALRAGLRGMRHPLGDVKDPPLLYPPK